MKLSDIYPTLKNPIRAKTNLEKNAATQIRAWFAKDVERKIRKERNAGEPEENIAKFRAWAEEVLKQESARAWKNTLYIDGAITEPGIEEIFDEIRWGCEPRIPF